MNMQEQRPLTSSTMNQFTVSSAYYSKASPNKKGLASEDNPLASM